MKASDFARMWALNCERQPTLSLEAVGLQKQVARNLRNWIAVDYALVDWYPTWSLRKMKGGVAATALCLVAAILEDSEK